MKPVRQRFRDSKARAEAAPGGSVPSGSLVTDKGSSLLSLSAPAHPLGHSHALFLLSAPRAAVIQNHFCLWMARSRRLTLWGLQPSLELARVMFPGALTPAAVLTGS